MGAVQSSSNPTTAPTPGTRADAPPAFAERVPLLRDAHAMAYAAHHGDGGRGATEIHHPVAVAEVLVEHGINDEQVLAAALLHDVLEDSETSAEEIGERFGGRVRGLVQVMTENGSIQPYAERKAEHRDRVVGDREAAAIYGADKLARCRQLRRNPAEARPERLEHYARTVELLEELHPELSFLPELRGELDLLLERARSGL